MAEYILLKQVKSKIGSSYKQKRTMEALGLKKMNRVVKHKKTPQLMGMINKVSHLVSYDILNAINLKK